MELRAALAKMNKIDLYVQVEKNSLTSQKVSIIFMKANINRL